MISQDELQRRIVELATLIACIYEHIDPNVMYESEYLTACKYAGIEPYTDTVKCEHRKPRST